MPQPSSQSYTPTASSAGGVTLAGASPVVPAGTPGSQVFYGQYGGNNNGQQTAAQGPKTIEEAHILMAADALPHANDPTYPPMLPEIKDLLNSDTGNGPGTADPTAGTTGSIALPDPSTLKPLHRRPGY